MINKSCKKISKPIKKAITNRCCLCIQSIIHTVPVRQSFTDVQKLKKLHIALGGLSWSHVDCPAASNTQKVHQTWLKLVSIVLFYQSKAGHCVCAVPNPLNSCHMLYSQHQSCLDVRPRVLQLRVRVHPEQDPQAASKTAGLLLQQIGLGFPFKA